MKSVFGRPRSLSKLMMLAVAIPLALVVTGCKDKMKSVSKVKPVLVEIRDSNEQLAAIIRSHFEKADPNPGTPETPYPQDKAYMEVFHTYRTLSSKNNAFTEQLKEALDSPSLLDLMIVGIANDVKMAKLPPAETPNFVTYNRRSKNHAVSEGSGRKVITLKDIEEANKAFVVAANFYTQGFMHEKKDPSVENLVVPPLGVGAVAELLLGALEDWGKQRAAQRERLKKELDNLKFRQWQELSNNKT